MKKYIINFKLLYCNTLNITITTTTTVIIIIIISTDNDKKAKFIQYSNLNESFKIQNKLSV